MARARSTGYMEVEDKSISNMISYLRFFRYFSSRSIWEPKVYPFVWSTVSSHSKMSPEISAFALPRIWWKKRDAMTKHFETLSLSVVVLLVVTHTYMFYSMHPYSLWGKWKNPAGPWLDRAQFDNFLKLNFWYNLRWFLP